MFYLDVKYLLVVCLCIYYEKVAVKTTLTTMGHSFEKKLIFFPSDIIQITLKTTVLNTLQNFQFMLFVYPPLRDGK